MPTAHEDTLAEIGYGVWLSYVRTVACDRLGYTASEAWQVFDREGMRRYAHLSPLRAVQARVCGPAPAENHG